MSSTPPDPATAVRTSAPGAVLEGLSFPFDPTGGYSRAELVAGPVAPLPEEPADYAEFWHARYEQAVSTPLEWSLHPSPLPAPEGWQVEEFTLRGMAGEHRIGGWLVRPEGREVRRGVVDVHGYGGRVEPDLELLPDDAAAIFPVCTGLPTKSLHPGFPTPGAEHAVTGIEDRSTYSHLYAVMDVWRAASALLEHVPGTAQRLDLVGVSFGGGIGAMALAFDPRFHSAHLRVPSLGNHPLRLGLECTGSGEGVRRHVAQHPGAREVLAYFDAAVAARRVTIPVHVAPAALDPSVPPAGQFAVYHALAGPKQLFPLTAGHIEHPPPGEHEAMVADVQEFFARPA